MNEQSFQSKGGEARAASLTPEQRSEIAAKAANTRWGNGERERPTVLANYKVPLGANEMTLTITGEKLDITDFEALLQYVELFKRQFERAATIPEQKEP